MIFQITHGSQFSKLTVLHRDAREALDAVERFTADPDDTVLQIVHNGDEISLERLRRVVAERARDDTAASNTGSPS